MNCQDCGQLLEEYLDGELSARAAVALAAHVAACETCAHAHDSLLAEQQLYAAYERDVEVTPRLWGGVEARINAKTTGGEVGLLQRVSAWFAPLFTAPRFSPALTAALVLVAVALTVGVMKLTGSRDKTANEVARHDQLKADQSARPAPPSNDGATPPRSESPANAPTASPASTTEEKTGPAGNVEPKPSPETRKSPANEQRKRLNDALNGGGARVFEAKATTPAQKPGEQTPEQLVREAEQRYIAAIQLLQRDVASKRSRLDAQTAARFDESLAAIDRSIAETRRAVAQHAGDPIAAQYMLSAYAKKVEVLREMAHVQQ